MKQKRIISLFLSLLMLLTMFSAYSLPTMATSATVWDGSVADSFAAGTGTKDDPYIIRTAPQLAYLSQFWGYFGAEAVHVRLESDIYLNDTTDWEKWGSEENGTIVTPANNWTPIAEMPFDAYFDGNGHTIYGMFAFQQNKQSGLFGYAYGNICNLTIAQSYVEGSRYVGAIAGGLFNGGTIVNSHNSGTVKGQQYVGGVCGNQQQQDHSEISYIKNCSNSGAVSGKLYVGGVCGLVGDIISGGYNTGSVSGETDVGGMIGYGSAEMCYNGGTVSGQTQVGGIIGIAHYASANNYNTGSVSGYAEVGGIIGNLNWSSSVKNSYNVGTLTCTDQVGGIVGSFEDEYKVENCYCLDTVFSGGADGETVTAEQLKDQEFLENWNFYSVWELGYNQNYAYPTLRVFGSKYYRYIFRTQSFEQTLSTEIIENGATYQLPTVTHEKYDFLYWECDGKTYKAGESVTATQDMTFTAYWTMPNQSQGVWQGDTDTDWLGSGTSDDPYLISSPAEFAGLAKKVNDGETYEDKSFKLTADILLNDVANVASVSETLYCKNQWKLIGFSFDYDTDNSFDGIFDGDGHSVSGLFIKGGEAGLFGVNNGTVRNLTVKDSYIEGESNVGAVVSVNYGLVENCHNEAKIVALSYDERPLDGLGGVVGCNYSGSEKAATVKDCTNSGSVLMKDDATAAYFYDTAGVVGYNNSKVIGCSNSGVAKAGIVTYNDEQGIITDCYNSGAVIGAGINSSNYGIVSNCYNTASIESDKILISGVVAMNSGDVENCYNTGDITYKGDSLWTPTGGVVADCGSVMDYDSVIGCYNTGKISGYQAVGGVVGEVFSDGEYAPSVVKECYNTGSVVGEKYVGGIVGRGERDDTYISNCYNTGDIIGETVVGGIVGFGKNVSKCYHIGTVSGADADPIVGLPCVPGMEDSYSEKQPVIKENYYRTGSFTGTTDTAVSIGGQQMQDRNSFGNWNFYSVWEIGVAKDYNYPTLRTHGSKEYYYILTLMEGEQVLSETLHKKGAELTLNASNVESEYDFEFWRNGETQIKAGEKLTVDCDMTFVAVRSVPNVSENVWNGQTDTSWQGSGISGDPYLIGTPEELAGMAERINAGYDQNAYFKLTADILLNDGGEVFSENLMGKNAWTPIGKDYNEHFRGNFDGDGHTISGIYINTSVNNMGLFGETHAKIYDVRIEDSFIKGAHCVGGLVGKVNSYQNIDNCYSNATVIGEGSVGGIAGSSNYLTISNCINEGNVFGDSSSVGGIVGIGYGLSVGDCSNRGNVTGKGFLGGIVGSISHNGSSMEGCSNSGTISGSDYYVGGLIGHSYGTVIHTSYNSGSVSGIKYVGGLVGMLGSSGTIMMAYNCGEISGQGYVGGLIGGGASATICDTYNAGEVLSSDTHDAIAGNANTVSVFNTNYKDTETSTTSAIALSDEQMRTEDAYSFSFSGSWEFGGTYENYPYPTLIKNAHVIVTQNKYTVTFVDHDDSVLSVDTVSRHDAATPPSTDDLLYVEGDYVYSFLRWDTDFENITEDRTVKAVYGKTKIIQIASDGEEVTVPRGFSKENLRTLIESRYSKMVCITDSYYYVISDVTWDISGYDPNGADRQIFHGTLALTQTPYYKLMDPNAPFGIVVQFDDTVDNEFSVDDLTYTVNSDGSGITITQYNGSASEIVIPSVIDGYQVTAIGEFAFHNSITTQSVILPNTVKIIGPSAFAACPNLVEIVLPEGLQELGVEALTHTGLTDVTLPMSLKTIGERSVGFNHSEPQADFVIYAYSGSAGAVYAEKNRLNLITLQQLKDEEIGVTASADSALRLAVVAVENGDYFDSASAIDPSAAVSLYEISLKNEQNESTQPGSVMTISIPVPDNMTGDTCSVYRINSDGSYQNMNAVLVNGRLQFATAHLSYYAVVSDLLPAPTVSKVTKSGIQLQTQEGYEYKYEGGQWQTDGNFEGLQMGTEYTFVCRRISDGKQSGVIKVSTLKNPAKAPSAPTVFSKSKTSVTLKAVKGHEYRLGSGAWQTSPEFTGLSPATEYVFYQRVAETSTAAASAASKGQKVKTHTNYNVLNTFNDIHKKDWYYKNGAIDYVYNGGLFGGTGGGKFEPNTNMTRGMFVTVLGRLSGIPENNKVNTRFADVKKGQYYTGYVKWASDVGIVSGTSATTFEPNANVTREQICKMMVEYCAYADVKLKIVNKVITFADQSSISSWARTYVKKCQTAGLVNGSVKGGKTYFSPQGNATRAEVATILMNFHKNYK